MGVQMAFEVFRGHRMNSLGRHSHMACWLGNACLPAKSEIRPPWAPGQAQLPSKAKKIALDQSSIERSMGTE
jgi:hypothetical protein